MFNHITLNYLLKNNKTKARVKSIKDLGIIFHRKLTFNEHINHVVGSDNRSYCGVHKTWGNQIPTLEFN